MAEPARVEPDEVRSLSMTFLALLLAVLAAVMTPIGTGQGVHQAQLLHPVLPHVHLINGRFVTHAESAAAQAEAPPAPLPLTGTALGAGSAADMVDLGLAVGPALPALAFLLPTLLDGRLPLLSALRPLEFREAPQTPPPTLAV